VKKVRKGISQFGRSIANVAEFSAHTLKGYFYINLVGTLEIAFGLEPKAISGLRFPIVLIIERQSSLDDGCRFFYGQLDIQAEAVMGDQNHHAD
jgi:hypothetical protein